MVRREGKARARCAIVACCSEDRVLAVDGRVPWRHRRDLLNFKKLTMGHPIVMGRKTMQTLQGPLPGRCNIFLSRTLTARKGFFHFPTPKSLIACMGGKFFYVIGGGEIYRLFLSDVQDVHLTVVSANKLDKGKECVTFPELEKEEWKEEEGKAIFYSAERGDDHDAYFRKYRRVE